jgi:hypothetical protein
MSPIGVGHDLEFEIGAIDSYCCGAGDESGHRGDLQRIAVPPGPGVDRLGGGVGASG